MWCSACQQDIPALGSPSSGGELRCGKCGGMLAVAELSASTTPISSDIAPTKTVASCENAALEERLRCPPLPEDDWTLEAELRGVQRLLSSLKSRPAATESMALHLPEIAIPGWHAHAAESPAVDDDYEPTGVANDQPRTNGAAWTTLSLSLAVFACGAVLLAWSLLGKREDLWPIGLPLALLGQAGLVLGLVLQIDGSTGRRTPENRPRPQNARRGAHATGKVHLPR